MILMINLKIYKYKLVNLIKDKKMTKDAKKVIENNTNNEKILGSLKANDRAQKVLFKATNISNNLMKLVPEMAVSVNEIIIEIDTKQKGKIKGQIDLAFLR